MAAGGYRLLRVWALVVGVIALFLSFFFLFLTAPLVPLGVFYLGFLVARGRTLRHERRRQALLEHEAEERKHLLERDVRIPVGIQA